MEPIRFRLRTLIAAVILSGLVFSALDDGVAVTALSAAVLAATASFSLARALRAIRRGIPRPPRIEGARPRHPAASPPPPD